MRLKQQTAKAKTLSRIPVYLLIFCVGLVLVKGSFFLLERMLLRTHEQAAATLPEIERLAHSDLAKLIDPAAFINATDPVIRNQIVGRQYAFYSSLDPQIQQALIGMMDCRWARHIAIVAMEAKTGRIVGMASYDSKDPDSNPCISAGFPAASLFKIVSAAAAVEARAFQADTRLAFNGGKYTLYRSQLRDIENRYTNYVTFEEAFAESINPVFGKIGKDVLEKTLLEQYAFRFGFNRKIDFDLPIEESVLVLSEKPYNWAEIACGFNSTTSISPVHAAMIAAAVINNGRMPAPRLIDTAAVDNRVAYRARPDVFDRPMSPQTAIELQTLMNAVITSGTARKSFSGPSSRKILEEFEVGGKTGSINNNPEQIKYDWLAGYARHRESGRKIAVAVLVAHQEYIGTRAPEYFRKILHAFMQNRSDT